MSNEFIIVSEDNRKIYDYCMNKFIIMEEAEGGKSIERLMLDILDARREIVKSADLPVTGEDMECLFIEYDKMIQELIQKTNNHGASVGKRK